MTANSPLAAFLARNHAQTDGFVATSSAAKWRLGAVLLAQSSGKFVVVRKAKVNEDKYEFEGLYALPGGMVRSEEALKQMESDAMMQRSLQDRAQREAGLGSSDIFDVQIFELGPIVTSYTAKGQERFTLMVPHICYVAEGAKLKANDKSIDASMWIQVPPPWVQFAPANLLIVAHIIWNRLRENDQNSAKPFVGKAVTQCGDWAASIGISPVPSPWATDGELARWRSDWANV